MAQTWKKDGGRMHMMMMMVGGGREGGWSGQPTGMAALLPPVRGGRGDGSGG